MTRENLPKGDFPALYFRYCFLHMIAVTQYKIIHQKRAASRIMGTAVELYGDHLIMESVRAVIIHKSVTETQIRRQG